MECWKAFTAIKCFLNLSCNNMYVNMENKVNSLIVDYEIVLGLQTYFGAVEKIIGFKCLVKYSIQFIYYYYYYCQ